MRRTHDGPYALALFRARASLLARAARGVTGPCAAFADATSFAGWVAIWGWLLKYFQELKQIFTLLVGFTGHLSLPSICLRTYIHIYIYTYNIYIYI